MTLLLEHELARRENGGGLELRPQPLRVRWAFDGLVSADGHDVRCTAECSVRALPDPIERRMLQEVLFDGRDAVSGDDVAAHFARALRAAVAGVVESRPVANVLADAGRKAVLDALKAAATPVAFASGVEVLAPFHLDVQSASHEQQRLREMQRALAERHAADQVEHFQRAGELLKRFQELRQSAPELSAGQVLQQVSAGDRGSVLQTLLLASAREDAASDLWAVAGPYLVRVDARAEPPRTELTPLPPTLGPLRSVQPARVNGQRVLLVGARSGFMVVRPGSPGEPELYADPSVNSQLGFSRVAYAGDGQGFYACHGEAGVVRWALGETSAPASAIRPEQIRAEYGLEASGGGPRNLHCIPGRAGGGPRVVFSLGCRVIGVDGCDLFELPNASGADVVAILPEDRRIVVVHEDGTVYALDVTTREVTCVERRGLRVRAAGALPWLGSTRLLLAPEDGPVQCVGLDDPLVTQYASGHGGGLKALAGSADRVAAVSADRQRLILWNSWDGRKPAAEMYLTGLTRHRIADVDFG
jgi:hypothetical protein